MRRRRQWFIKKASDYAKERTVFGRPIGQNQGIQFPIANPTPTCAPPN
jgi:alkylation response protein AidB-like acyl-CoA dehydrogenase